MFSFSDVTHTAICNSISFHDHGNNTEGKNVYMEFPFNDKALCHEECKHVQTCSGYTYEDDSQRCFLSSDTMFIDTSSCFSCRFYEKTCQSCMYSLYIYIIISWFVSSLINFKIRKTSKQNLFVNVKRMPCFI